MKKLLQVTTCMVIICVSTALYIVQSTAQTTPITINSKKLLREIQEFAQTVNLSGPLSELDEQVSTALSNLLGTIITELTGVQDLNTITPEKEAVLKKTLPEATNLLVTATVFAEEPQFTLDLMEMFFTTIQQQASPNIKSIFNDLIKLGTAITKSNDPADKASLIALKNFIIGINGIITALRQSLAATTPTTMNFNLIKTLANSTTAILKKVIEKHPTEISRLLNTAKKLTTTDFKSLDLKIQQSSSALMS